MGRWRAGWLGDDEKCRINYNSSIRFKTSEYNIAKYLKHLHCYESENEADSSAFSTDPRLRRSRMANERNECTHNKRGRILPC